MSTIAFDFHINGYPADPVFYAPMAREGQLRLLSLDTEAAFVRAVPDRAPLTNATCDIAITFAQPASDPTVPADVKNAVLSGVIHASGIAPNGAPTWQTIGSTDDGRRVYVVLSNLREPARAPLHVHAVNADGSANDFDLAAAEG